MLHLALQERYRRTHGVSTDPSRPAWVGLIVVLAFVAALVLWGWFAPVSEAAVAQGSLRVEGNHQAVQQPDGGVVRELKVKEGQHVRQGQLLMTLTDTAARSQLDVLTAQSESMEVRVRRLIAERDNRPDIQLATASGQLNERVAQILASERAVMMTRRHQHDTEIRIQRDKITQLEAQIRGMQAQLAGIDRQTRLLEEEAAGARTLYKSGFAPKTRILGLERDMAGLTASREGKIAEIASSRKAIDEARLELVRIDSTRLTEIADQIRTIEAQLAEVRPKLIAARDVLARTEVRAPATGAVVGLTVFTEGGVIQPGAKLADIVPDDSPLIVDARLPIRDIDQVARGHAARIDLTSIDRNHRPRLHGKVLTVSADRVTDATKATPDYYTIQVAIDPEDVKKSRIPLQSGMSADVVVTGRQRTFAEYLIGPLLDEVRGAFHER